MKKLILLTIIMMASTAALGCVGNLVPGANTTVAPTVGPSSAPSPATVTPEPGVNSSLPIGLKQYETGTAPNLPIYGVLVTHEYYYMRDDMSLPPMPDSEALQPASHGAIHQLDFWNTNTSNQTMYVNYFISAFKENYDDKGSFVSPEELFYDPNQGFFSSFVLAPDEHRTVYVYAYITDSDYNKYHGMFTVGGMAVALYPPYD